MRFAVPIFIGTLLLVLLIASQIDKGKSLGPHWESSCARSTTSFIFFSNGKTTTMQPVENCVAWTSVCVTGSEYKGADKLCVIPPDQD